MINRLIFFSAALVVCFSSCTKDHTSQTTCVVCQPTSFKGKIIPIFSANCAIAGCHDAQDMAGGLVLDSASAYSSIFNAGYVSDSASNSILYTTLLQGATQRMPQVGSLDNCSIHEIYCWIQEGAPNN